jgi:hypothetical protein
VCFEAVPAGELLAALPCGHRCLCVACAATLLAPEAPPHMRACPKCRTELQGAMRVFDE